MAVPPPNNGYLNWAVTQINENILENPKVTPVIASVCIYGATRVGTSFYGIPLLSLLSATLLCSVQTYNAYKAKQFSKVVLDQPKKPNETPHHIPDEPPISSIFPVPETEHPSYQSSTGTDQNPIELLDDEDVVPTVEASIPLVKPLGEPAIQNDAQQPSIEILDTKDVSEVDLPKPVEEDVSPVETRENPENIFQGGASAKRKSGQKKSNEPLVKPDVLPTNDTKPVKKAKKPTSATAESQENPPNPFQRGYSKKKRHSKTNKVAQTTSVVVTEQLKTRINESFQKHQ